MKRRLHITSLSLVLSLLACTKTSSNNDEVFIRIANASSVNFSNFVFMDKDFGSIANGDTTIYQQFEKVLPLPFANFVSIDSNSLYIIDVAATPFLANGKYLMQVVDDTLPWRYKASFIKE